MLPLQANIAVFRLALYHFLQLGVFHPSSVYQYIAKMRMSEDLFTCIAYLVSVSSKFFLYLKS